MAGSASDYAEKALIDWLLGGSTPTRPANRYVGLFTAAAGEAGGGTEVSGNNYSRQAVTYGPSSIGDGTTRIPQGSTGALNNNSPTFSCVGGPWGTVVAYAVFDAATGGNELYYATFDSSRQINDGDTFSCPVGYLYYTQD